MFLSAKWLGVVLVATAIWAAPAFAADVENGDLFVGSASVVDGYGNTAGGIWRVRNGVATLFCASPDSSFDPGFWNVPNDVIVDSQGRIVFIAPINGQNWGLLRCATPGAPAEHLAVFRSGDTAPTGWPDPFPNSRFGIPGYSGFVGSLHILKQRVITDDFQSNPQVHNADAYEFIAQQQDPDPSHSPPPTELFRYDTETQTWKHGIDLPGVPNMSSVIAHGDSLHMLLSSNVLRRVSLPLEIGLSGKVNGVDFQLSLGLFGGAHELADAIMDDTTVPNVSSGCNTDPPGKHDDVTDEMPLQNNGFIPLSADRICYDEHGGFGLVVKSGYGPYPGPYLTQVSSFLLNDDPMDDNQGYFHQGYDNCRHVPWIQFAPILPYVSNDGTFGNAANVIATAPGGMVGTQFYEDRVIRLTPGDKATVIATLYHPQGIAAYPAIVPSLGTVVYLTIHSPVDVLVTDAAGKRIGVDPDTGNPVNDFGANGFDSGAGEPRIFAIKNPAPGGFKLDAIGTSSGSYMIDISAADLSSAASSRIQTLGNVSIGDRFKPGFTLDSQSTLNFALRALNCTRTGAGVTVAFEAVAGKTYRLERKTSITDASWQSIAGVADLTASSTGSLQITDPNAISLGHAFYRVRLLP
jgi:hypothetical protein